jgi:hypothetical protein
MLLALLIGLSPAADEDPPPSRPPEVVVYGDRLIDPERRALEQRLIARGYSRIIEKDGYAVFRHDEAWRGEFRVHDDGWVRFKRQPVQFRPTNDTATSWAGCALIFPCLKTAGQTMSERKFRGVRRRQTEATEPYTRRWSDRVADRNVDRVVDELPPRLEALWFDGEPLEPGQEPLPTPDLRKRALLDFWESRTDTIWGDRVRAVVEIFIRAEVQTGPFAFSADEIRAFNQRRRSEAALDLDRPQEELLERLDATEQR